PVCLHSRPAREIWSSTYRGVAVGLRGMSECLAVHASELVVKPDVQILRRYRRPLLLRLEHTHRPTLEDYVHRATPLGSSRSLNLRIGIRRFDGAGGGSWRDESLPASSSLRLCA